MPVLHGVVGSDSSALGSRCILLALSRTHLRSTVEMDVRFTSVDRDRNPLCRTILDVLEHAHLTSDPVELSCGCIRLHVEHASASRAS